MNTELEEYIEQIYQEPYHAMWNNCYRKSMKIMRRAKELGVQAELISCISVNRNLVTGLPIALPHAYIIIDRQMVNVALNPEQEERYYRNDDISIHLPVRVWKVS